MRKIIIMMISLITVSFLNGCKPVVSVPINLTCSQVSLYLNESMDMKMYLDESSQDQTNLKWTHQDIIEVLADCFILHSVPAHIRSDNGPEFIAKELRKWFKDIGVNTSYIEPGSPWENGYCESFKSKMRDEFLNMEVFSTLSEAKTLTKQWVLYYNTIRPHSSLNYQPPAPLSFQELKS